MTSATGDPDAPEEDWMGLLGATESRMTLSLDTTVENGMDGVLRSKNILLPVAYWDDCTQTHTGWWEGWGWGNMWVDEAGEQQFIFWLRLFGLGELEGLKLIFTTSTANIAEYGMEIQGYLIDFR